MVADALALALMTLTLGAAPASATSADAASASDPWWGPDKAAHLGLSAGASFALYAASTPYLDESGARALVGGGLALAIGGAKELVDLAGAGQPSGRDMAWNVLGVALGVGVAVALDIVLMQLGL